MIEALNNDYDLAQVEVPDPFEVGDTKAAWVFDHKWLVHWRDRTTLMITPDHAPSEWRPAHIYAQGGGESDGIQPGFWSFALTPDDNQQAA